MKAAGLMAIDTLVHSKAVLIKSKQPSNQQLVDKIASRLRGLIGILTPSPVMSRAKAEPIAAAQQYVLCQYNVPRSLLSIVGKITPGKRAPTVTQLDEPDWVAVSSMVEKKKMATVMDELASNGATDILVLDIANSR